MAAGMWYLYFTLTTLDTSRYKRALRNHIGLLWGLTISTYSVVTCGFPEEKEYQLELRYWPPWLTASLIISLMGMTTLIVLTVLGCRRL